MKKLLLGCLFGWLVAILPMSIFAQEQEAKIDPEQLNADLMYKTLKSGLFKFRLDKGIDTLIFNEDLQIVAQNSSDERAGAKDKKSKKPAVLPKFESVDLEIPLGKTASVNPTYTEAVLRLMDAAAKKKEQASILSKSALIYYGIGFSSAEDGKKIFVNIALGGVDAIPVTKKEMKALPQKVSKKIKVGEYNKGDCKQCESFDGSQILAGLYVEGGKIYLKHNDIAKLKKFFNNSSDGIVIEVIQREQYTCEGKNLVNYYKNTTANGTLTHKGKVGKFISGDKFLNSKKNRADASLGELDVPLQKMPKKIKGEDYEFNVILVKNKSNCKTIVRTFDEFPDGRNIVDVNPGIFLPDTALGNQKRYQPKNETKELSFKIPFERGKYNYNTKDIDGFIQALGEPRFTISRVAITSHSSIEADTAINRNLRILRAKSIVNAIDTFFAINKALFDNKYGGKSTVIDNFGKANQPNTPVKAPTTPQKQPVAPVKGGKTTTDLTKPVVDMKKTGLEKIIRDDNSWNMFLEQIKETPFERFAKSNITEVNNLIMANPRLLDSLEPLLAEQRFAQIDLTANLDYSFEEPYIQQMRKYKAAMKNKNAEEALYMQKNLIILYNEGKVVADTILKYPIPMEKGFAPLHLNKMWLEKKVKGDFTLTKEDNAKMKVLYELSPENEFVRFNYYLCQVSFSDTTTKCMILRTQNSIDSLYKSSIPSTFVDKINVEFQFDALNSLEPIKGQKLDVYKVLTPAPTNTKPNTTKTTTTKATKDKPAPAPTIDNKENLPVSTAVNDLITQRVEKLKKFYEKPLNYSWQNAFKAASLFYKNDNKEFAKSVLKPFMTTNDKMDQDVYFAFICLAGKDLSNTATIEFRTALSKAKALNEAKYCKLFGAPNCSYQLLDDPFIKATYCGSCK